MTVASSAIIIAVRELEHHDGDRIALMRAFVECARRLNFKASAKALGLTPSTLGRRIARLEARLGVALFLRSTRRVTLTEAGAIYLPLCEDLLSALDEADATASSLGGRPTGLLRVAAPTTFSRLHLTGRLPKFLTRHPEIRLDIAHSDAYVDLVEERIDIAIRIGRLADTSLRARFVRHRGARYRSAPLAKHIDYLKRDGVTRDGHDAAMFDWDGDAADERIFASACEDDRHHFRFIVSPEDAG
ncbi:MAG: LysR family transcriptional regulator, partial [Hyphomicrobiales bacterium]|nr:LysR family transcriptional regulator [Hyphomicrobiales bacterium]